MVVAVLWALLDRASQAEERGDIRGFDAEGVAYFFGWDPEQVESIVAALEEKGVIANGRFSRWEKYQPKREDGAAERAKEWRERRRTQANAGEPPDTDTEVEIDKKSSSSFSHVQAQAQVREPSTSTEPSRQQILESQLRDAAGWQNEINPNLFVVGCILDLIDAGADLQRDVLDTIRSRAARMQRPPGAGWAYFVPAILEAREKRVGIQAKVAKPQPRTEVPSDTWQARLGLARKNGRWPRFAWGPMPGETGCAVPAAMVQPSDGVGWLDDTESPPKAA
jgi:hypothetical protein